MVVSTPSLVFIRTHLHEDPRIFLELQALIHINLLNKFYEFFYSEGSY
jgi:hypothetical protein